MRAFKSVLGQVFGRLTVVADPAPQTTDTRNRKVTAVCSCGMRGPVQVRVGDLRSGDTTSCGCVATERKTTHGLGGHRLYHTWKLMHRRCYNPLAKDYQRYGGRGITVDDAWHGDFGLREFLRWAKDSGWEEGLQLDRIDNSGGYSADNCRWVTAKNNMRNRRSNRLVCIDGRNVTVSEASEITGIRKDTLKWRLDAGWPVDRALSTPVRGGTE